MSSSSPGDSSATSVDAAVLRWRGIAAALTPVIGAQGFAALYKRSVHLAKDRFSALAVVEDTGPPFTFLSLQGVLAASGPEAGAMQAELLRTFHDLLAKLIGASLTERLLGSEPATPSNPEHPSALERKL